MRHKIFSVMFSAALAAAAGLVFQGDLAAQAKGEGGLVTSGVKLEPILIGKPAPDKARSMADEGTSFDGPLNIVTDTPYQIWGAMGTYIHLAAFDPDFKPASGAAVYLDGKAFGAADKNGTFVFSDVPNPDQTYGASHTLEVVYTRGAKKYYGSTTYHSFPRTESFGKASVFVYTDRGAYNPGQTVHIRAICWGLKDDFSPLKFKSLEFLLKDDKGHVVAGGGVETDTWGIASMDIPLPENAPEGVYKLEAAYEGESASADLRIERFTPPVIEITHTLGRFLARDIKELPFEVTLGCFGGGTFRSGKIRISVMAGGKIAHEETKQVSGSGPHKFLFDEKTLDKIRKPIVENDTVQVGIAVTDEYGRFDEVKRAMRYTSNPYVAVVEMDKDQYTTGETAHVMVRMADLDQVPVREKEIKLVIDNKTYKAGTDKGGIVKFDVKVPARSVTGAIYLAEVSFPVGHATINWIEPRPMSSEVPQGYVKELQPAEIVIRFPMEFEPRENVVHVDIVDSSGALIGAVLVPVTKQGKVAVAKGKFPAPAWGSMLLTLFCIGAKGSDPVGLLTDGQNLPVKADRQIEITMEGLPGQAAPGAKIKVKATVRNAGGKEVSAAVGASIVDQAVLSLLDPLEKTPMDRFYNPQLKVLSTSGSKILTWPVVSRNWGNPLYDIALPPFGFREGGASAQQHHHIKTQAAQTAPPPPAPTPPPTPKPGDQDGDAVADAVDKCPMEPEVYNGYEDTDGCPDTGLVIIKQSKIVINEKAGFLGNEPPAPPSAGLPPGYSTVEAVEGELAAEDIPGGKPAGSEAAGPAGHAGPAGGKAVSITVRTNFAETSLWAPDIEAEEGKLEFYATLPDSITTQTVTLVASDNRGGVGMLRKKIEVRQDLYVRSNLPSTLTAGDSVEVFAMVRNLTKKDVSCRVSFKSEAIEAAGKSEKKVTVPAGGAAAAAFTVKAVKAGTASYEVRAEGGSFMDIEKREIFVRPLGIPDRVEAKGTVEKDKPFKAAVKVSGKDSYITSLLSVSFPTAVPAIQGMEAILGQPGGAIDFVSSKALVAAMVYQYLLKHGKNEKAIEDMGPALQQLMASLLMTQNPDGGWGWHFMIRSVSVEGKTGVIPTRSNPYLTAQSLEALIELKRAGLPVPEGSVERAMGALSDMLGSGTQWPVDDIAFWEGNTGQVRRGVSAEIFRVMADACGIYPNMIISFKSVMDKLAEHHEGYLSKEQMKDPMALANAAMGVYAWAMADNKVDAGLEKKLKAAAKRLLLLRKEAYWEPSWFNAYGGTIEATTAAMLFMYRLDKEGFEAELRRSIQYILSTQKSFGAWHNARGTAAAVRALLLIPPTGKEVPSTVRVLVGGELVDKVDINPDDPYLSAVRLRQVEITKYLKKGDNMVEVSYDGNLEAPVTLLLQKWGSEKAGEAMKLKGAPDVSAARTYKGEGSVEGAPVEVIVKLDIMKPAGPLIVREPLPSNAQVEGASLDKLIDDGKIAGYEMETDAVVFTLAPGKPCKVNLSYRLDAIRAGSAVQPGTLVSSSFEPGLYVAGRPTTFVAK